MARKVFFSFEYGDVNQAMIVRNSWVLQDSTGFIDKAEFESIERGGDPAIRSWINRQLLGTSVTTVLVGKNTCTSKWVRYEIEQSIAKGNALIGIDISSIKDFNTGTTTCCGRIPAGYPFLSLVE